MDNETVDKKGGKVKEFSIHVSRKVWTEDPKGSLEVGMGETISVGSEEDHVELERQHYKELKERVLKAVLGNTKPTTIKDAPPEEDDFVPPSPDDFVEEQVNIPIDDKGQEKIIFPVETIEIESMPSGDKVARIRGKVVNPGKNIAWYGNYMKWGIKAYKEAMAELGWDLEGENGVAIGKYPAPAGLKAVCLTKERVDKEGNLTGELEPTKVEEWK